MVQDDPALTPGSQVILTEVANTVALDAPETTAPKVSADAFGDALGVKIDGKVDNIEVSRLPCYLVLQAVTS